MYINNKLIDFLNASKVLSNSTIIVTDLSSVLFVASDSETANNTYLNHSISKGLKQILTLFSQDINSDNYINSSMNEVINITSNDNISNYKSQIILPIVHNNYIDGLLIFITKDRNYIKSNLEFAKTTKHFVEVFTSTKYI